MNRMLRLLKHRWHDEGDARRALDDAALKRLETRVRQSEAVHSGEIRLVVEPGLPWSYLWKGLSARDRAVTLFGKLRVWDTEHNNGVLIYLLLADRAIEIVADRGVARAVPPLHWREVVRGIGAAFRAGRFEEGLAEAIAAVDRVLREHWPLAPGASNPNELPDRPLRG
jgi:uncharacterized membrane protein